MIEPKPLRSEEIILDKVHLASAQLTTTPEFRLSSKKVSKVKFGVRCDFEAVKDNVCSLSMNLSLDGVSGTKKEVGLHAEYQIIFSFKLTKYDDYLERNTITELQNASKMMLASIAYSTSRGILYERAQGTFFSNFILPIIAPHTLIENQSTKEEK